MEFKNKSVINFLLVLGIFVFAMFAVSAALITPATSGTVTGAAYVLNATNTTVNTTSCTFWAISTLTANNTWTNLTSVTEVDQGNTTMLTTFDSTLLEDSNDYQFLAECENATASSSTNTSANTGVTVDNTNPDTPTSLSPSDGTIDTDGSVTFAATVQGNQTTSCTLRFDGIIPPGGQGQAMTHTGDTCSLTISAIPSQSYNWFVRASDETTTADSSTITSRVDSYSGVHTTPEIQKAGIKELEAKGFSFADTNTESKGMSTGWIVVLIIALLVVIGAIVKRK